MATATPSLPPQVAHAPAAFIRNVGQAGREVVYESASLGYRLEIGRQGAVVYQGAGRVELQFPGSRAAAVAAEQPGEGRFHFQRGRSGGVSEPLYGQVRQRGLYAGIDAVYYGSQSNLEYDFVVHPGARAERIRMRFAGATVEAKEDGGLAIAAGAWRWEQKPPLAFQRKGGVDRKVEAKYAVSGDGEISLVLGEYDRGVELTIDPILSPFGNAQGAGLDNTMLLSIDPQNNVYAAQSGDNLGTTGRVIRVVKFLPSGLTGYVFHLQVEDDILAARSIAAAADGSLAVGGLTTSRDLPTTSNSFQRFKDVRNCSWPAFQVINCRFELSHADGFVLQLRASGTLQWATYLGAGDRDAVQGVAFGPGGTVYAAGETLSNFFPTKNQFQGCTTLPANAFLTVLRADGSDVDYSTCLRPVITLSSRQARASALAVDAAGMAYVAGFAVAGNGEFPVRAVAAAPFQATAGGGRDGFLAKFNPAAAGDASLVYSTLVGGSGNDVLDAITLEPGGGVCAAGRTESANYPRVAPPRSFTPLNAFRGPVDMAVTCLSANASSLTFSNTYGVGLDDQLELLPSEPPRRSIVRDAQGAVHATTLFARDFPAVNELEDAANVAGVYLRLAAGTRAVEILSHTPEVAGSVVTDSASVAFVGTTGPVRKFDLNCAGDVTSSVQVLQGNIVFDIATNRFRQSISLRSLLGAAVPAGGRLVFTALPGGVAVFQAAGVTSCFAPAGAPFVTLPQMPPFGSGFATINVEFTSTGAGVFYVPKVGGPNGGI